MESHALGPPFDRSAVSPRRGRLQEVRPIFGMSDTARPVTGAAAHRPVHPARDDMMIAPGNIYLGVPDHHLIVRDREMRLCRDSLENMAHPSIDPLFRSAAVAYGPMGIGVLLSGLLNDGAAGLETMKRCGGVAIVQDPVDAIADEMPLSGMLAVTVDLAAPCVRLGNILPELVQEPAEPRLPMPPEIDIPASPPG